MIKVHEAYSNFRRLRSGKEYSEFTVVPAVERDLLSLVRGAHEDHEQHFEAAMRTTDEHRAIEELATDLPGAAMQGMLGDAVPNDAAPVPSKRQRGDGRAACTDGEDDGYTTEPYVRPRANARNVHRHRSRRLNRENAQGESRAEGALHSAAKEPKAHTAKDTENVRMVRSELTREQECSIPAGAGYTAKGMEEAADDKLPRTLEDLDWDNGAWELLEWDGGETIYITNSTGDLLAVFPKTPSQNSWQHTIAAVTKRLERARVRCGKKQDEEHRRGGYSTLTDGSSFGGGQTRPRKLVEKTASARRALKELLSSDSVRKVIGFGNAMLKTHTPGLHEYYRDVMEKIHAQFDDLECHFDNTVFSGVTFNIGERVVTYRHRDHLNIPFGLCCVTAFGTYDANKGGHLILWDLNIVVRIPPGATYLIPSAILRHSNVDIAAGETRMSITQFFAGGLARWVECGGMSQGAFERDGNQLPSREQRWKKGIELMRGWVAKGQRTPA